MMAETKRCDVHGYVYNAWANNNVERTIMLKKGPLYEFTLSHTRRFRPLLGIKALTCV